MSLYGVNCLFVYMITGYEVVNEMVNVGEKGGIYSGTVIQG